MIIPTALHFFGARAYRDTTTGRWASRAQYLAQADAFAQAQRFARGLMMALCRPVLGSRTPGRAVRHTIHEELGRRHPERAPRLQTPGQARFYSQAPKWGFGGGR